MYRVMEINNIEPLKISSRGSQSTYSEPSTEHIPGSTIRGAIIAEMIRLGLFNYTTKNDILLNMECYNAYPYFNGLTYLPKPFHLRTDKNEWRKTKIKGDKSTLNLCDLLRESGTAKNQLEYSYVTIKDNKLFGKKVAKEYRLHHFTYNSGSQDREQENIFRYEAISPEQSFKAVIRYEDKLEEQMEILFKENLFIYLGGSKGSGYGRCKICSTRSMNNFIEVKKNLGINYDKINDSKEIVVTCLSDCLFRNEFGQPINYIPKQYFSNLENKVIKLEKQFVQTGQTEGYNTTWKARYPKETTLKAGSVLKYVFEEQLTENEMSKLISSLESGLVGIRTQDGYGWLGVNIEYPKEINIAEDNLIESSTNNKGNQEYTIDLSDCKVKQTLDVILSGMDEAKERWLNTLYSLMKSKGNTDEDNGSIIFSDKLNKSQLKNMEDLIDKFLNQGEIEVEKNIMLERPYTNDKNSFSLNGCNFKQICIFLNKGNDKLNKFAEKKLNSRQGKFFYYKYTQNEKTLRFIAELVKRSLKIKRMGEQ